MTDKITEKTDEMSLDDKIAIIVRQTNYNEDEAKIKMQENENNYLFVIKEYMGSKTNEIKKINSSLNQEIYRQIRYSLQTDNTCIKNKKF